MFVGEIGKKIMIKLPVFKEKEYIYIKFCVSLNKGKIEKYFWVCTAS